MSNKSKPVTSCDKCGACCTHMATPPMFAAFFPPRGKKMPKFMFGTEDHDIVKTFSRALWAETRALFDEAWKTNRSAKDVPCFWFDEATRRCRHWEFRPTICREFEVGGEDCKDHRERVGLTVNGRVVA